MFAARGCTGWGSIVSAPNVSIVDVFFVKTICSNNEVSLTTTSVGEAIACATWHLKKQPATVALGSRIGGPSYPLAVLEPGLWSGKEEEEERKEERKKERIQTGRGEA